MPDAPPRLHILEAGDPQATPLTLAQLAHHVACAAGRDAALIVAGPTLPRDAVAELFSGCDPAAVAVVGAPDGRSWKALPALRRAAAELREQRGPRAEVVLWSPGMLSQPLTRWWVSRQSPQLTVMITHPPDPDATPAPPAWAKRLPERARLVGVTDAVSEPLSRRIGRAVATCPAYAPAYTHEGIPPATRARCRALVVADPPARLPGMRAMLMVGLADEVLRQRGKRLQLVLPPGVLEAGEVLHTARALRREERAAIEPRAGWPWRVLPGCDAAVVLRSATPNAITCALRSGRPTVAEDSPAARALIDDGVTGLISEAGKPQRLAHRLVELLSDEALATRLGNAGKQAAEAWCGEAVHEALDAR